MLLNSKVSIMIKTDYAITQSPEGFKPISINGVTLPYHSNYNPYPYYIYCDNLKPVKTVSIGGIIEYRDNCVAIGNSWFIKGVDVEISKDGSHWVKTMKYKKRIKGVIGFNDEKEPIMGSFHFNPGINCSIYNNGILLYFEDYRKLPPYYVEQYSSGVFYNIEKCSPAFLKKLSVIGNNAENNVGNYTVEDSLFLDSISDYYNDSFINVDRDLKYLNSYISPLTFGFEYESSCGNLPVYLQHKHGVVICKDGSLKKEGDNIYPPEYVTIPLSGAKGLQTIRNLCKDLSLRNHFDDKCSLHIHIGGIPTSRLYMVSLFKLCYKIQDQVFEMFPSYKSNELKFKKQEYCKKLPDILPDFGTTNFNEYINDIYKDLFLYITDGVDSCIRYNRKNKKNPFGAHKWHISTRYHWVNFTNMFFNNRNTVEFRLHTPTFNQDKSINWLLMCIAIIKYAQQHPIKCISGDSISFKDVLLYYKQIRNTEYGEKLSYNLIGYYNDRVEYFKKKTKQGEFLCIDEEEDKNFKYNVTQIS